MQFLCLAMIKAFCLNLFENGDVVGSSYVKLFFCKKLLDKGLGRSLIETCSLTIFQ